MLSWVNINFNVLVNTEDMCDFKNIIHDFANELNRSTGNNIVVNNDIEVWGVSSVKFKEYYMDDAKIKKYYGEKGLSKLEEDKV